MTDFRPELRLLLIDDDVDMQALLSGLLGQLVDGRPYRLDAVHTSDAGVAEIRHGHHDVVILDYQIDSRTGLDVLSATDDVFQRPPIVMLTGRGSPEIDRLCLDAGACDYWIKDGLDPCALERSIRHCLQRHRLMLALLRRERDYRTLFASNPVAMFTFDHSSYRISDANDAALFQYGYRRDEFLAMQVTELRAEGEIAAFVAFRGKHADASDVPLRAGIWRHERKDGSALDVEIVAADVDTSGTRQRLVMAQDVTERVALNRELALLKRAVESATDGISVVDLSAPDQPLIYVNAAFEHISGYRANEVLGRNCRFLQGDDSDQQARQTLISAIAEGQSCEVVLRNYRKDGEMFWNRLRVAPVLDHEGRRSHYIGIMTDVTAAKRNDAERLYFATHDALTGLAKFSAGDLTELDALLATSQAADQRLVVLFIDIDRFHSINDAMGFEAGDQALRAVASRIATFSDTGKVLRFVADQFLMLLPGVALDADLGALATQLCETIAEPLLVNGTTLYLTASVGVSATPDNPDLLVDLIRQAEIAKHQAKLHGRNGGFTFGQSLRNQLHDRRELGARMRDGLAAGEFVLHYQPQVHAQTGALLGLEALVRWQSPEFGLVAPSRFIPVAETNGMIVPIGNWVLQHACAQLRAWIDLGHVGFVVSVNVSAAQMQRPRFVEDLTRTIKETGIRPEMLELELTESVLINYADRAVLQMHALRQLGVRLALDDFGTGFSSLSYLLKFPLDKIKIDQSFISGITHDGKDAALVRAMIAMGHHLGLQVVAEGVETAAQYLYLRRGQCDQFQGFYFSAALPAEDIPALLARRSLLPDDAVPGDAESENTLLVLDDEENIRRSLVRLLRPDGYRILVAATADEAFSLLAAHNVQVVLSDQRMPGMNGTEFLGHVKNLYPDTVRMVLSGFTDVASVTEAINVGAIYKFLAKPWDDEALRTQVRDAFRRYKDRDDPI